MRILVDTHTFIWYTGVRSRLSSQIIDLIESDETDIELSIVSLWEIAIKNSLGRLEIENGFDSLPSVLERYAIDILPVSFLHTSHQNRLPFHHKDPFDRMIAAQALVEGIDLVSDDGEMDPYFRDSGVKRIW
ncbi:MAG: type II toxin-antitoxin system VapC family toxin [Pyrinomonadaceae bacterium]